MTLFIQSFKTGYELASLGADQKRIKSLSIVGPRLAIFPTFFVVVFLAEVLFDEVVFLEVVVFFAVVDFFAVVAFLPVVDFFEDVLLEDVVFLAVEGSHRLPPEKPTGDRII